MFLLIDPSNLDGWLTQDLVSSAWRWLAQGAASSVTSLLNGLGASTEPDFHLIVPAYDRMLAVAALLAPLFVAGALIERALGGHKGAGVDVIPRALAAAIAAYAGIEIVRRCSEAAGLLAGLWNADLVRSGAALAGNLNQLGLDIFGTGGPPLVLGILLSLLLGLVVYLELLVRSALILLSTVFLPLVCAFSIWPRFASTAIHLSEFLLALLLSKFVIVTALYVGLLLAGAAPADHLAQVMAGVALLAAAAFSPALVIQGVRFAEASTSSLVRGWTSAGVGAAGAAVGVAVGGPAGIAISKISGGGRANSYAASLLGAQQDRPQQ